MKYKSIILLFLCTVFLLVSCQQKQENIKDISVKKISSFNTEDWKINIVPKKDHNKWVYDVKATYLKNKSIDVKIKPYSDNSKYGYKGYLKEPIVIPGNYESKESVYSKENNKVKIKLEWTEEKENELKQAEAEYELVPRTK
ncbi:hypothetical protein ACU5CE_29120 [Priestia megaterium]|uniref:hypothetical protein n=1 Tax=Priestia megaterium TaxID=1404 RepID=UPI00406BAB9D